MTNREKFEEVFGLEIDDFPAGICDIIDHRVCENNICDEKCPAFKFWNRNYLEESEDKQKCEMKNEFCF